MFIVDYWIKKVNDSNNNSDNTIVSLYYITQHYCAITNSCKSTNIRQQKFIVVTYEYSKTRKTT